MSDIVLDGQTKEVVGWVFGVKYQNKGPTRAVNFKGFISVKRFDPVIPEDFSFTPDITVVEVESPFDGNSTVNSGKVFVPIQEINLALAGKGKLYVWGRSRYFDIFPNSVEHHIAFCITLDFIGDITKPGTPFMWSVHTKNNYVD